MNYYLLKIKFDTAVHFGTPDSALSLYSSEDHFCADTLFSALCHTAHVMRGDTGVSELLAIAERGELLLSDGMPWSKDEFYIPKPCVISENTKDISTVQLKAIKKLAWIPLPTFSEFEASVHGKGAYNLNNVQTEFGLHSESTKVRLNQGEASMPYQLGLYRFFDDCGMWFIAGCADEEQYKYLLCLIDMLGISGIGGKTSSGYGKFHIEDEIYLNEPFDEETSRLLAALEAKESKRQLLLSTSLPPDKELELLLPKAEFRMTRRGGYIRSSVTADENRKKRVQYFLSSGSVLPARFSSELQIVGKTSQHLVYRFSGPIFLGVDL